MKTVPMIVMFLPRFRWFVWGFGLCAIVWNVVEWHLTISVFIGPVTMLCLGAVTYPAEFSNRRLLDQLAARHGEVAVVADPERAVGGVEET